MVQEKKSPAGVDFPLEMVLKNDFAAGDIIPTQLVLEIIAQLHEVDLPLKNCKDVFRQFILSIDVT